MYNPRRHWELIFSKMAVQEGFVREFLHSIISDSKLENKMAVYVLGNYLQCLGSSGRKLTSDSAFFSGDLDSLNTVVLI